MKLLRRNSTKLLPIAGVRSSLVSIPVASVAEEESTSFAAVLAQTMSASQSFSGVASRQQQAESRNEHQNSKDEKIKEATGVTPRAISIMSPDNSIDLCERLETLLQHKSLLIAVA